MGKGQPLGKHGTGGGNRTHKGFRPPDFESSASANSATPALLRGKRGILYRLAVGFQPGIMRQSIAGVSISREKIPESGAEFPLVFLRSSGEFGVEGPGDGAEEPGD